MRCELAAETAAPSYVCTGGCGERIVFGVSKVLGPADMPPKACGRFQAELLRVFGVGGPRRFDQTVHEPLPALGDLYGGDPGATGWDGTRGGQRRRQLPPAEAPEPQDGIGFQGPLGRNPGAQADPALLEQLGWDPRRGQRF